MTNKSPSGCGFATDRAAPQDGFHLVVCAPDRAPYSLFVGPGRTYTVGRRQSSDIVLDYPWASDDHAIVFGGNPPEILDLGGPLGTILGGTRLLPNVRAKLEHRAVVAIGGATILVQCMGDRAFLRPSPTDEAAAATTEGAANATSFVAPSAETARAATPPSNSCSDGSPAPFASPRAAASSDGTPMGSSSVPSVGRTSPPTNTNAKSVEDATSSPHFGGPTAAAAQPLSHVLPAASASRQAVPTTTPQTAGALALQASSIPTTQAAASPTTQATTVPTTQTASIPASSSDVGSQFPTGPSAAPPMSSVGPPGRTSSAPASGFSSGTMPVAAPAGRRSRRPPPSTAMVTKDPAMKELHALIKRVAASSVSVLILGETGVGKELVARAIHDNSSRRESRLVTLNCAAIPENLVESELFGFERGAFSGAVASKPGLFEVADKSTLFLDEIGELPRAIQPKLLRALETGEVSRLGSIRTVRVDVRIVAATNRDIANEVAAGTFRADLFYRLNGMTVKIPPLRERPGDIVALAEHFAGRVAPDGSAVLTVGALTILKAYAWPGNVRELRAVVERAVLLAQGSVIEPIHLLLDAPAAPVTSLRPSSSMMVAAPSATGPIGPAPAREEGFFPRDERPTGAVAAELKAELAMREQRRIRNALERAGGNQTDAAKLLGISRRTLINRIEQFGIARPRKKQAP